LGLFAQVYKSIFARKSWPAIDISAKSLWLCFSEIDSARITSPGFQRASARRAEKTLLPSTDLVAQNRLLARSARLRNVESDAKSRARKVFCIS